MEAIRFLALIPFILLLLCRVAEYKYHTERLEWAAETLYLNVRANREMWRACKRFRWCDESHAVPRFEVVWEKELFFLI